jgi:hypothetical protein
MPYIEDITDPLIHTLTHSGGLSVHQLAGHAANLEFWAGEVKHVLDVIDGYPKRFNGIQQGEKEYAERQELKGLPVTHGDRTAPRMRRGIKDQELKDLRRRLADAMHHILNRCYNEELITENELDHFGAMLDFDIREIKR